MAEYDSRTINCGLKYSFWKDYINAVVEMTECKHLSGGVIFKVHLKITNTITYSYERNCSRRW